MTVNVVEVVLPAVLLCGVVVITLAVMVNVVDTVTLGASALMVTIARKPAVIVPMAIFERLGAQVLPAVPEDVQELNVPGGNPRPVNTTLSASLPPLLLIVTERE